MSGEAKLYTLPGSHPSVTAERGFELKGIPCRRVELVPLLHFPQQRIRFGKKIVPAVRFPDGEKVSGSGEILRRLDERVPEPSLRTTDPAVAEAERWGDQVLQDAVRRIDLQAILRADARMAADFTGVDQMPLPRWFLQPQMKLGSRLYARAMASTEEAAKDDLRRLPELLDRVDGLIAAGTLGGDQPNAADLQIGSSLRLVAAMGDTRPLIEGRPALDLAERLFGGWHAELPAGLLPPDWLP